MENKLDKMPYCKANRHTSPLASMMLEYINRGTDPLIIIDSLIQESDEFTEKVAQMQLNNLNNEWRRIITPKQQP